MSRCSFIPVPIVVLCVCFCQFTESHRLMRASLPKRVGGGGDGAPSPLQHVENIAEPIEDIELRQKPPHVLPEEINSNGALMAADLTDLLNEKADDMRDCVIIHQYAEPLTVGDAMVQHKAHLSRNEKDLPPLVRQGAIWDDSSTNDSVPLAVEMFAYLEGISGLVQVVPHGGMAKWTSKEKVPIGGYLCSHDKQSASAPVLHATPTPCIPTSVDKDGSPLDPVEDGYEVFIGTTRVRFDNVTAAEEFCMKYTKKIASDLSRTVWDASTLGEVMPQRNPDVGTFVALTGRMTSPQGWTKGRKKLLVVVMDWKRGDETLAPYSKQSTDDPIGHYKTKIFPRVNQAFEHMSWGQFGVDVTFVPEVTRYTRERNRYTARKIPFPALYDAARDSLEGQRSDYKFDDYDLVYVVAPQVKPTGTKGVAWVGKKGAMCNGCETISDNFKVMVAVHELGHNLGLLHASSTSLEYGNPFDWMGNYPDVVGLNYGLGYLWSLGWLPSKSVFELGDSDLSGLNTLVVITPHDVASKPRPGQVVGVRISLRANSRDLWVAFRSNPEGYRNGIFLVQQDKDNANSELIDAACHSPSQQDASLKVGWMSLDPSHQIGIKVISITETEAKVQLFAASPSDIPKIYGQDLFTDGESKCPVTCQDADWLVQGYTCPQLKSSGYCKGGALTLQGTKYSIGLGICPQECGRCKEVMQGTPLGVSGGCQDRNIKISGKSCRQIPSAGWCGYETKSGSSVGKDLCPVSCGECPKTVAASNEPFDLAGPTRTVGQGDAAAEMKDDSDRPSVIEAAPAAAPAGAPEAAQPANFNAVEVPLSIQSSTDGQQTSRLASSPSSSPKNTGEKEQGDDEEDDEEGDEEGATSEEDNCFDDPNWVDAEGDTCAHYAQVIKDERWTQRQACSYGKGAPKLFCRKTCDTCVVSSSTCADITCISSFKKRTGRCEQCADWAKYCKGKTASWFRAECPLTCGACKPDGRARNATPASSVTVDEPTVASIVDGEGQPAVPNTCHDDPCITAWKVGDKCPTCEELGNSHCPEQAFASACKETCNLCVDGLPEEGECKDVFSTFTCNRYKLYGWCGRRDMRAPVSRQCPLSCGLCKSGGPAPEPESFPSPPGSGAAGSRGGGASGGRGSSGRRGHSGARRRAALPGSALAAAALLLALARGAAA